MDLVTGGKCARRCFDSIFGIHPTRFLRILLVFLRVDAVARQLVSVSTRIAAAKGRGSSERMVMIEFRFMIRSRLV